MNIRDANAILVAGLLLLTGCSSLLYDSDLPEIPRWESTTAPTEERLRELVTNPDAKIVGTNNSEDIIYIREKLFIAQTNEIYVNSADYLGKTIRYEGIFGSFQDELAPENDEPVCFVIRNGPGCCPGVDNSAGFEVVWEPSAIPDLPAENDWVEVTGVLEEYDMNGWQYLRLRVSALEVLEIRGAEFVEH